MIVHCSRVGVLVCLEGYFVLLCPKIYVSPLNYFWLHNNLLTSSQSSQWYFIKHISPNIPPSLISDALFDLRKSPELVLKFISHIEFHLLDVDIRCLAIAIVAQPSPKRSLDLEASERLSEKSSLGFDLLVQACCEMKRADEALECFYLMKDKGVLPNNLTCNDMLSMFLKMNRTDRAWVLYAEMFRLKIKSSVSTLNIMINVLCKEGKLKRQRSFLGLWRLWAFSRMLCSLVQKDKGVEPDSYTYGLIISGMCKERKLEEASGLFDKMLEIGLVSTAVTFSTLIDGYCNKGDLDKAFGFRDEMVKKGVLPTVSTYNLLIHALLMEGKMVEVDDMVKEIKDKGMDPDAITYNILISGYCRSGIAKKAFSLRDEMLRKECRRQMTCLRNCCERVLPDLVMFALIDGHCANGTMECAFALLETMDKMKVHPDGVTYNTLMQGCSREGKVEEARQPMEEMKRRGIKPVHISFNTLISGYSKRGDLKDAFKVRNEMLGIGFNPTVLTYNALIQGVRKNPEGDLAEELLKEMASRGIRPNDNTYYSLIEGIGNVDEFLRKGDSGIFRPRALLSRRNGWSQTKVLPLIISDIYIFQ
ncbi:pentatricopeptide repeat-containing protein [Pyrus ussuriensis x Pyrus communis]|uniref:Pentatricopeptide repeat-containing protein n=1 Tax=Pyrus ussuriensis x Pyrus communis TaxID=2448454 RepID=A0A5N5I6I4_9ROSA|nr:pentatricopeptide repeat-containing protein [Pyrus ussuriensis x Pyrus communis]